MFGGSAWLVLGVPVSGGLLYKEEFDCMMRNGESSYKCNISDIGLCDIVSFESRMTISSRTQSIRSVPWPA
jgi:hypothetical protein